MGRTLVCGYCNMTLRTHGISSFSEECIDAAADPRAAIETASNSITGIMVTTTSASLSMVGSALIILLILRSGTGLGSIYHRILFCLSVFDLFQSAAIAFTTLPMPTDMIYDFDGIVLGNDFTCNLQGSVYTLCVTVCLMTNAFLCIYHFLSIRCKISDEVIRSRIEPISYAFIFSFSFTLAFCGWYFQQFNPNPVKFSWCSYSQYPYWCAKEECTCERGDPNPAQFALRASNFVAILCFIVVISTLTIIVIHVYRQGKKIDAYFATENSDRSAIRMRIYRTNLKYTKEIVHHALLYTIAYFFTYHQILLQSLGIYSATYVTINESAKIALLISRPSQGFLNLIIFVRSKVVTLRHHNTTLPLSQILRKVFRGDSEPSFMVSNIAMLQESISRFDRLTSTTTTTMNVQSDVNARLDNIEEVSDERDDSDSTGTDTDQ